MVFNGHFAIQGVALTICNIYFKHKELSTLCCIQYCVCMRTHPSIYITHLISILELLADAVMETTRFSSGQKRPGEMFRCLCVYCLIYDRRLLVV